MASGKVLIVDDSATDLENLKSIVASGHYQVVTGSSGQDAIDLAASEKPDVILLDIVMEQIDGYRACREIAKNPDTESIPVVFVSSKNQKADEMWAKKQGGKALISKPYTDEQILQSIQAYA